MNVCREDFQPINCWIVDAHGPKFSSRNGNITEPQFIIDATTGKRYLNESTEVIRFKCFFLSLGTPLVHIPYGAASVAYKVMKLLSNGYFWSCGQNEDSNNDSDHSSESLEDSLRIVTQIPSIIGLELASIYGVLNPLDGRKLYASIERAQYGGSVLAPCFQPEPKKHLLDGDIDVRNEL